MASAQPPLSSSAYPRIYGKLPERSAGGAFGQSSTRDGARLERERHERAQREAQNQAGAVSPLASLTDEQREEINEAFALFDLDKDQRIDYHEFKVALKALGFDLPKAEIISLLTTHGSAPDHLGPGPNQGQGPGAPRGAHQQQQQQNIPPGRLLLTLPSFQNVAATLIAQRDPRAEILRAFALFDTEGKGMISLEDLRRVARELGEGLEEEELVAMIEEFDLEGKGGVGREEFVQICMG